MITRKVALVAALALPLALSGCTTETAPGPASESAPPPAEWAPRQPRPADRDRAALAEVDKLDLCALIDLGVYAKRKANDTPVNLVPWIRDDRRECRLTRDDAPLLTVTDEESTGDTERRFSTVVDLGGIKGYQLESRRGGETVDCVYRIPVSFRRAIRIDPYVGRAEGPHACKMVKDFAAGAAAKLPKNLVYPPDGQDTGAVGACADLLGGEICDPAVPVPVPEDHRELLVAGEHNPNVLCATFAAAVAQVYGPGFRPVATPNACYFVESQHRLQIEAGFTARGDNAGIFGSDTTLWKDKKKITVVDKPAVMYQTLGEDEFDIYASPTGDLDERGHVRFRLSAKDERGIHSDAHPKLSKEDWVRALRVMELVIDRHFLGW
ncbi:hypothetical protein [Amycolatopsis sp. NPDC059021]|uniref:hypothetical protein n=1 Tax=Amycolatopsis sp. NPDC059021 TaxID=3346704 RepID=UPI0036702325